ncbi:MAG TPA: hypothetical protein VMF13_21965 [Luteitalea sp.]|nr:hypothetical protein [Luteitalea sp.]
MTLVDRYLSAVRFFLPRREQDDILRELTENLTSELEDRAEVLGRDLTEAEIADILRRHGHPVAVAGRYGAPRQLIGPIFFPIYWLALKVGIVAAAAVTVLVAVIAAASHRGSLPHFFDAMMEFPERALIVFAWTTIAFAVLDVAGSRTHVKADWDPRRIPDWMVGARRAQRSSRVNSVVDVVFGVLALGWLLAVPTTPVFALGPLAQVLDFAPVWRTWYIPLVVVAAAQLAVDMHALVWPGSHARRTSIKLGLLGAQLVIAAFVLSAHAWVVARPGITSSGGQSVASIVEWVNAGFAIGFVVVLVITLIEMGKQIYRLKTMK